MRHPTKAGQGVVSSLRERRSVGVQTKQLFACSFCRQRKIACKAPPAESSDKTCDQCARRNRKCEYPTVSLRGKRKHWRSE
ncbi:hypothetical protein BGW80DRAFT_1180862 [Lactifluus volemus]|nr:hypothetical protein BGW80DRAFT_1180862 [Lactifluus volemus]